MLPWFQQGGESDGFFHLEGQPQRLPQPPEVRQQPARKVTLTKGALQQPQHPPVGAHVHSAGPPGIKSIQGIHPAKKVLPVTAPAPGAEPREPTDASAWRSSSAQIVDERTIVSFALALKANVFTKALSSCDIFSGTMLGNHPKPRLRVFRAALSCALGTALHRARPSAPSSPASCSSRDCFLLATPVRRWEAFGGEVPCPRKCLSPGSSLLPPLLWGSRVCFPSASSVWETRCGHPVPLVNLTFPRRGASPLSRHVLVGPPPQLLVRVSL